MRVEISRRRACHWLLVTFSVSALLLVSGCPATSTGGAAGPAASGSQAADLAPFSSPSGPASSLFRTPVAPRQLSSSLSRAPVAPKTPELL